jgi:YhcG PDDEXK nuclease domain
MGHGFCLEARQKRILIGDEYFFIDLVFYHRVLKCHVLIDLKVDEFNHNNASQLNTYLSYCKKEMYTPGDNPPVGILLVTKKNEALVEYATAGLDEQLFVRKYMLELPDKKQIEAFIKNELRKL